tara:strand:+ start:346 stop:528 length:183 start_codon:yes stop_codon:yes gene_type:complete
MCYNNTSKGGVMSLDWYLLAKRWQDKCIYCGETDQRLVTFSVCYSCKSKNIKSNKNNGGK